MVSLSVNAVVFVCLLLLLLLAFWDSKVQLCISSVVTSQSSVDEGWDTEDIYIPDEDLLTSDAKTLMDEAKAGNVEELQAPCKVTSLQQRTSGADPGGLGREGLGG